MNAVPMLEFLSGLAQNNDPAWFHAHEGAYREAVRAFETFVEELMERLRAQDGGVPQVPARELTFKLQRDTRFSHDKSPYNPCFRAHIGGKGKLPIPVGYYVQLRPGGGSFLGGGLFADMFQNATAMVRDYLVQNGDEWEGILTAPAFASRFTVGGAKLKKVPQGCGADHPQAEYLKHKSWYLEYPVPDADILRGDFVEYAAAVFLEMRPFNGYLNRALAGFEMPKR